MLQLRKMTSEGFQKYYQDAIRKIAKEYVISGYCDEDNALEYTKNLFREMLPQGLETLGHYIFDIVNGNQIIGMIWYMMKSNDEAFICDFIIKEEYRGQGFGTETMKILEEHARGLGIKKMTLHVFGHNKSAIALYQKLGYTPFSMHMAKEL